MKKLFLLLSIFLVLASCNLGQGSIEVNKTYNATSNFFDYMHDYVRYPKDWRIISKITKSYISEIDYDADGYEKPQKKKIPVYIVYYSYLAQSRSGVKVTTLYESYTIPEYKALKIKVGDVVTTDKKEITSKMDPILLSTPEKVNYTPPSQPYTGRYVYDSETNPENQKLISEGKVIDIARYRKEGVKGPICLVSQVGYSAPEDPMVTYANEFGIVQSDRFPHELVKDSNLKGLEVIEIQWEGSEKRFCKLPFYLTNRP